MSKRKVLFILNNLEGGGAEVVVVNLLNNLDRNRFQVGLLLLKNEGVYLDRLHSDIEVHVALDKPGRLSRNLLRVFRKTLKVSKMYDVLIGGTELIPSYFAFACAKWLRKPVVSILHTTLKPYIRSLRSQDSFNMLHRWLNSYIYPRFDKIITVSGGIANELAKDAAIKPDKIETILNPIDLNCIRERSAAALPSWAGPVFKQRVVISAGRLAQVKGFDVLIRAHAKLIERDVAHHLVILGEGPERPRLEELIRHLGLDNTVHMPGFIDNPYPLIKRASVFCLSSRFEGFALVIAEALSLGTPVVSTDCPYGPSEILADGEYGLLTPVDNQEPLASSISQVLSDACLASKLSQNGPGRASLFALERIIPQYDSVLEAL
jgi:glycosyltransferase involved in cell wall biosynthesis